MGPDILDIIILISMVFFIGSGLYNGLIGEVGGICAVIFGFWAASAWNQALAPFLGLINDPNWRLIAAYIIIFFAVMLCIGLLTKLLTRIVTYSFASWINRLGGAVLGFVKGFLLWLVLLIILQWVFPHAEFIQGSRTIPYFKAAIPYLQKILPPQIANRIYLS